MYKLLTRLALTLTALVALTSLHAEDISDTTRKDNFSLNRGALALGGYDPVSYWSIQGPKKGKKNISTTHKGIVYRFANKENKSMFLSYPAKFEPQYGGWCAWAMIDGKRTKPNPDNFKIVDDKLYLFYKGVFGDTLKLWNERSEDEAETKLIETASNEWVTQIKG